MSVSYSWYKEVDPNNPSALIPLTEKTFKYKFEATIPEPDVCTDCILARITVINVIAGDYGTYVLRATSEQSDFKDYMSESKVRLYRNIFAFYSLYLTLSDSNRVFVIDIFRNSGVPAIYYESGQPRLSQSSTETQLKFATLILI